MGKLTEAGCAGMCATIAFCCMLVVALVVVIGSCGIMVNEVQEIRNDKSITE